MNPRNYQALSMTITPEMRLQYMATVDKDQNDQVGPKGIRNLKIAGFSTLGIGLIALIAGIASGDANGAGMGIFVLSLIFGLILVGVGYGSVKTLDQKVKMSQFARDNNMTFANMQINPVYSGMIFGLGHSRKSYNMLRSMLPVPYEIGEYTYTVGSGKNQHTYFFGYAGIALQRRLPHMVLDAKGNNGKIFGANISNLPVSFSKDQTLSLEGDFNNYFTLYAPKEYERDALYIFSPDIMALMIDNVHTSSDPKADKKASIVFDAEIVDNRLFLYTTTKIKIDDTTTLDRFFNIIDAIGAKMIDQTKLYADERIGNTSVDAIAQGGVRLKNKAPVVIVVIVVILIAISNIGSIVSLFE